MTTICYMRVSSVKRDGRSRQKTDSQRLALQRSCKLEGIKRPIYIDDHAAGRNQNREGFQRVLETIRDVGYAVKVADREVSATDSKTGERYIVRFDEGKGGFYRCRRRTRRAGGHRRYGRLNLGAGRAPLGSRTDLHRHFIPVAIDSRSRNAARLSHTLCPSVDTAVGYNTRMTKQRGFGFAGRQRTEVVNGLEFKVPVEDAAYPEWSTYAIGRVSDIMEAAITDGNNKILIYTNLKRGLPLENINKVAGPFVEAWALERFEAVCCDPNNPYELVHVEAGARLDPHDIVLQFKRTDGYVSSAVDVKATSEDIPNSGKSPNITSYARIRTLYVEDPDYMFLILSLKHKVYGDRDPATGMTHGVMEIRSYNVYDIKHLSDRDISYNPALGTGQIQIRDIHYVTTRKRTTWDFCKLLDAQYINSSKHDLLDLEKLARKHQWVK